MTVVYSAPMKTVLFFQPRRYGSWRRILTGLQRFARERDWLLHVTSRPDDDGLLPDLLRHWSPRGCIMDCGDGERPPSDRSFGDLPVVLFNLDMKLRRTRHPVFHQDSEAISRLAARHLLSLDLADYAFVPHPSQAAWSDIRARTFAACIRKAARRLHRSEGALSTDWLHALPKPCGIFAANDAMAQQVVALAQAGGIRVPDDLAVLGVDNDEIYCEGTIPGISSIGIDHDAVGYRLGEILAREMEGSSPSAQVFAYDTSRLILRGTTHRFQRPEPGVTEALDFIRRFACSPHIRIADVVARMKCSRREATLRFRQATGRSILEEIHSVRIRRMCELLETGDARISAVINFCGYLSEAFPKRLFVKQTGMTMRTYRKTKRHT